MLNFNHSFKFPSKGVYFVSLGGIGEIGANCYLYCCDGKWIMIDLGLAFADEKYPGIDLLVPKLDILNKFLKHHRNVFRENTEEHHQ